MKNLNVTFEDQEYKKLVKVKKGLTWHDFILKLVVFGDPEGEGG